MFTSKRLLSTVSLTQLLSLFTGGQDFISISDENITFSGRSLDLPSLQLRLIDDTVPETTEGFFIHLMLPPVLDYSLSLENSSASVIILDNDGEISVFLFSTDQGYLKTNISFNYPWTDRCVCIARCNIPWYYYVPSASSMSLYINVVLIY